MSVSRDDLRAFADGELSGKDASVVEAAIAADPALAEELAAEKRLREALAAHFDPIVAEPVPDHLSAMIAASAGNEPAKVVNIAEARERRKARFTLPSWGTGSAIAASLVLGMLFARVLDRPGDLTESSGGLVASGELAKGLETQLAANAGRDGGLKIMATFQSNNGNYCRVFDKRAIAGIACRDSGGSWLIERAQSGMQAEQGDYRQAGSADSDLLAAAQEMTKGEPFDAAAEAKAIQTHWQSHR